MAEEQNEDIEALPISEKVDTVPGGDVKVDIPPEGGVAGWLVVLGCSLCLFTTFGFLNASILCVFSLCMTSLATKYYQIILAQGIGFGLGAGGIFATGVVCVGQWFVKNHRGLAVGIVVSGSSLGGVIFPFFVNKVVQSVGFDGAVRYTALFVGTLLVIACFLVKARFPGKKWDTESKWVDFALFKDKSFTLYTIGAYFVMWGLWSPFDYLSTMAVETSGFSPDLALYLISIINASSIVGRVVPGWIADHFGYFNIIILVSGMTGISVLALWIPFDYHPSHVGLIVFSLVFGFVSGGFVTLMMPCVARSGELKNLGQRFGTFQVVLSLSVLTSLPIQGAILTREGSFLGLQLFAAVSMILGTIFIVAARIEIAGPSLTKKI
ncbi:hypothetical protein B7494_g5090 [Chlorociboria aeruginascens]|nr:hypothetical protein B7494_g5090 [Chlorociboria aeruginascens]